MGLLKKSKIGNITNFNFKDLDRFKKVYVLVSGGVDSTYLYEMVKQELNKNKIYPTNCFNPYEINETIKEIEKDPNFIKITPKKGYDYGEILKKAFLKLPAAAKAKECGKYSKKIFGCCSIIKHKAFLQDPTFKEPGTVVISGIKYGDGAQRRLFLIGIRDCRKTTKGMKVPEKSTFYYEHKGGQQYCYPFRDFKDRELPLDIINELKIKYPILNHSGCIVCPILVLFQKRMKKNVIGNENDTKRFLNSINYAKKLNVYSEKY